jgi:hypothetical protein
VCTLLYAVPRTSVLGAILLTGLFGGAMATHLRVGSPLVSHLLFGLYLGLLMWGGLYLRDARLRALIPFAPSPRKHMSLTLHYHPLSSFCWKALIALYENDTPSRRTS